MKVTVCELPDNWAQNDTLWNALMDHLASDPSDLLVLPEMPFFPWITRSDQVEPALWNKAVSAHDSGSDGWKNCRSTWWPCPGR